MASKVLLFLFGVFLQRIIMATAAAPAYSYSGGSDCQPGCPSPNIQLIPVPSPVPIKVQQSACKPQQQQSVTIPTIILAMMPSTPKVSKPHKPPSRPPSSPPSPPPFITLPIPQPYPVPICDSPPPPHNGCSSPCS